MSSTILGHLGINNVADVDVRTISLRGTFEGQVRERGRLAGADVHPEEVAGLGGHYTNHVFTFAGDVALRMRVDPVDEDPTWFVTITHIGSIRATLDKSKPEKY